MWVRGRFGACAGFRGGVPGKRMFEKRRQREREMKGEEVCLGVRSCCGLRGSLVDIWVSLVLLVIFTILPMPKIARNPVSRERSCNCRKTRKTRFAGNNRGLSFQVYATLFRKKLFRKFLFSIVCAFQSSHSGDHGNDGKHARNGSWGNPR